MTERLAILWVRTRDIVLTARQMDGLRGVYEHRRVTDLFQFSTRSFLWLTVFCHLLPICSANSGCLEFPSAWALSYTARNTNYQITAGPANRLSNNSAAARLGRDMVQPPRFISSSIFSVRQTVCTTAEMLSWLCLSVCLSVGLLDSVT